MLLPEIFDLALNLCNVVSRLLNGCPAVAFAVPPVDVLAHLSYTTLFLAHLIAELAGLGLEAGVVHQLQTTRLTSTVLLVTLLTKVPPLPVSAGPSRLVKVAHGKCSPVAV